MFCKSCAKFNSSVQSSEIDIIPCKNKNAFQSRVGDLYKNLNCYENLGIHDAKQITEEEMTTLRNEEEPFQEVRLSVHFFNMDDDSPHYTCVPWRHK